MRDYYLYGEIKDEQFRIYKISEVAKILGLTIASIEKYIRTLRIQTIGKPRHINELDIEAIKLAYKYNNFKFDTDSALKMNEICKHLDIRSIVEFSDYFNIVRKTAWTYAKKDTLPKVYHVLLEQLERLPKQ